MKKIKMFFAAIVMIAVACNKPDWDDNFVHPTPPSPPPSCNCEIPFQWRGHEGDYFPFASGHVPIRPGEILITGSGSTLYEINSDRITRTNLFSLSVDTMLGYKVGDSANMAWGPGEYRLLFSPQDTSAEVCSFGMVSSLADLKNNDAVLAVEGVSFGGPQGFTFSKKLIQYFSDNKIVVGTDTFHVSAGGDSLLNQSVNWPAPGTSQGYYTFAGKGGSMVYAMVNHLFSQRWLIRRKK